MNDKNSAAEEAKAAGAEKMSHGDMTTVAGGKNQGGSEWLTEEMHFEEMSQIAGGKGRGGSEWLDTVLPAEKV